jgi:ribosome-binding protein aMBF1 (putative translation factor)
MKISEKAVEVPKVEGKATSALEPLVFFKFNGGATNAPGPEPTADYTPINDLVTRWSKDEQRRAALESARQWTAETTRGDRGDTVRTFRLRKGWSQAQLAAQIQTSQPHVARIERGTENLALLTCRRLCAALSIDMNTLNAALLRQEMVATNRAD